MGGEDVLMGGVGSIVVGLYGIFILGSLFGGGVYDRDGVDAVEIGGVDAAGGTTATSTLIFLGITAGVESIIGRFRLSLTITPTSNGGRLSSKPKSK